jgi:hypothetical protein
MGLVDTDETACEGHSGPHRIHYPSFCYSAFVNDGGLRVCAVETQPKAWQVLSRFERLDSNQSHLGSLVLAFNYQFTRKPHT